MVWEAVALPGGSEREGGKEEEVKGKKEEVKREENTGN